jgi:hypothetical protein
MGIMNSAALRFIPKAGLEKQVCVEMVLKKCIQKVIISA